MTNNRLPATVLVMVRGVPSLWMVMVPPRTMLGQQGFGLEGVLDTTFQHVTLEAEQVTMKSSQENQTVYGLAFASVQVEILGIPLIPKKDPDNPLDEETTSNFVLFADPSQGNASNMGWLATYAAPEKDDDE